MLPEVSLQAVGDVRVVRNQQREREQRQEGHHALPQRPPPGLRVGALAVQRGVDRDRDADREQEHEGREGVVDEGRARARCAARERQRPAAACGAGDCEQGRDPGGDEQEGAGPGHGTELYRRAAAGTMPPWRGASSPSPRLRAGRRGSGRRTTTTKSGS